VAARLALTFLRDRRGATAIEYGLICAVIFLVILGSMNTFGSLTTGMINNSASAIGSAM
jgi:pilus assembly protein Flp/PilA